MGTLIVLPALAQSTTDYDTDNDGLIEIRTLEQLNAVRWDLSGSGSSSNAGYATAFPDAATTPGNMGCPSSGCTGYELMSDLDFDTGTAGDRNDDTYHNSGAGWDPIGVKDTGYTATFDGNGRTISNLFINRSANDIALFADIGGSGSVRNLGLVDVNVSGNNRTGALVGHLSGDPQVTDTYGTGTVTGGTGHNEIGGLAGFSDGNIVRSYFTGTVTGPVRVGGLVGFMARNGTMSGSYADVTINVDSKAGGLVGELGGLQAGQNATITGSYATGAVTGTTSGDSKVGGLVGEIHADGRLEKSYFSGAVSGTGEVGGLVGKSSGHITSSYAAGSVSGSDNDVGGLAGFLDGSARVTGSYSSVRVTNSKPNVSEGLVGWLNNNNARVENSYYDTDVTAQTNPVRRSGNTGTLTNVSGKTAVELQAPTSATGIYSTWDTAAWHFGSSSQYPALKADLDGNNSATWQEFGFQVRETLTLAATLSADDTQATVRWNTLTRPSQWGNVRFTYQVYRSGTEQGDPQSGTSFTDSNLAVGPEYAYQVAALLDNEEVRRSNAARVGGYDSDADGLLAITSLDQLNAIRWDLDGNGDPSSNETAYFEAFPSGAGATTACPSGRTCNGYELMADLDFDTGTAGDRTDDSYYNSGSGWEPVGDDSSNRYNATFDGNGRVIANLFINRGSTDDVGLFSALGANGLVRNLGLLKVNVTGDSEVGSLTGNNYGTVTQTYATGRVSGDTSANLANVGGLVGFNGPGSQITKSWTAVDATSTKNAVGGLVGGNQALVQNSYAVGSVHGNRHVGGLIGRNDDRSPRNGRVLYSYSTGRVTGTDSNINGLLGSTLGTTQVTASYYDSATSGQAGDTGARITSELQAPTSNTGLYSTWDPSVWDFGTSSQYPALKVDFNGDDDTTWQEFGYQVREAPSFTEVLVDLGPASVSFEWNAVTNPWRSQRPAPTVSYALYRDDMQIAPAEGQTSTRTSYTDSAVTAGDTYVYQVAALVNGLPARWGSVENITVSRDRDNDGLLDITNRAQLNAIRYDLGGDGTPAGNESAYFQAFPSGDGATTACPSGTNCTGYELLYDITLSGSWTPIGGNVPGNSDYPQAPRGAYDAVFEGNGNTISGLRISAGSNYSVGLFGATGSGATIRNVCLENVNVRGLSLVGALVGQNQGTVSGSCSTGQVTGNSIVGGLVGWNRGTVETSYSGASVTGFNTSDASGSVWSTQLGGLVGQNAGTIRNTYATGAVKGRGHVAGLAGSVWNDTAHADSHADPATVPDVQVEFSYSIGPVSLEVADWPHAGGLVGWVYGGRVANSYWDVETSGQGEDDGASQITTFGTVKKVDLFPDDLGKTTNEMKRSRGPTGNTYDGWTTDVWNFRMSSDYPCLSQAVKSCDTSITLPPAPIIAQSNEGSQQGSQNSPEPVGAQGQQEPEPEPVQQLEPQPVEQPQPQPQPVQPQPQPQPQPVPQPSPGTSAVVPAPTPTPVPAPAQQQQPVPTPVPVPAQQQQPMPTPVPVPAQQQQQPAATPIPAPAQQQQPVPTPVPAPAQQQQPAPTPIPAPAQQQQPAPTPLAVPAQQQEPQQPAPTPVAAPAQQQEATPTPAPVLARQQPASTAGSAVTVILPQDRQPTAGETASESESASGAATGPSSGPGPADLPALVVTPGTPVAPETSPAVPADSGGATNMWVVSGLTALALALLAFALFLYLSRRRRHYPYR